MTKNTNDLIMFLMTQEKETLWDIKEHKAKRSRSQNAYYWELAGRVAVRSSKFGININERHNRNLRELGLRVYMDNQPVCVYIPDNDEAERAALKAEWYHLKPTSQTRVGKDGSLFRCYVLLRGSHTFNTAEMSALLDLMIQEAKSVGVETITPNELEHMKQLELQAERRKQKNESI